MDEWQCGVVAVEMGSVSVEMNISSTAQVKVLATVAPSSSIGRPYSTNHKKRVRLKEKRVKIARPSRCNAMMGNKRL